MVGKTSIFTRYTKKKFSNIDVKDRTVQACCSTKKLNINKVHFTLNIWDTAGEEKYHALAPLYYRDADGAVLVFDMTNKNSFDSIEKWFLEISNVLGESFKFILCGNKCDLESDFQVQPDEGKELAEKYGSRFMLISALIDKNVDNAFKLLALGNNIIIMLLDVYQDKLNKNINDKLKRRKSLKIKDLNNVEEDKDRCC